MFYLNQVSRSLRAPVSRTLSHRNVILPEIVICTVKSMNFRLLISFNFSLVDLQNYKIITFPIQRFHFSFGHIRFSCFWDFFLCKQTYPHIYYYLYQTGCFGFDKLLKLFLTFSFEILTQVHRFQDVIMFIFQNSE